VDFIPISFNFVFIKSLAMIKKTIIHLVLIASFGCAKAQSAGGSVNPAITTVCAGTNSGLLTVSGQTGNVVRWQSSVNNGASWTNISNTTANLAYSNLSQTTWYRCEVLLAPSPPNVSAYSSPAVITVDAASSGTVSSNVTVCSGTNSGALSLSGTFTAVNYWEYSADGVANWNTIPNTSASQSYTNLTSSLYYRANVTNGTCPAEYSSSALISVSPPSAGGTVSGSDSACSGSNSGMISLSGYTGSILRWQYSTDGGVSWTNITNTTSFNNYSNISTTTDYRAVIQSGACPTANSTNATVTIFPISVGGTVNSNATVCYGTNNGTLLLVSSTGNVVHWESSSNNGFTWNTIANATDTISYSNLQVKTQYRALVQSGACTAKYSSAAVITVNAATVGGSVSGADTVCSGSNSGSLLLNGYVGSIVRWQSSTDGGVSWSNISNTTAICNYININSTTLYRAVVQVSGCPAVNSSDAGISVFPVSEGGTLTPDEQEACAGLNNGTIMLSAHSGTILHWESSVDGGVSWSIIPNITSSLNFQNLAQTTLYRTVVQNGQCAAAYSDISTISISPATVGGTTTGGDTVCAGTNNGSIVLSGFTGKILNWEFSIDGGITWTHIANTTAILNYTNLSSTTIYRAVVQSGSCATSNSATSTILVTPASSGGTVLSNALVCDSTSSGTLTLSGYTGNILHWEYSIDGGAGWISINNTASAYTYTGISAQTLFRAVVQSGNCQSATSSSASVSLAAPVVATFSVTINGATASFTNTGTSNNGTSQWNFGDNTTSAITSPAHSYAANGSYPVTLILSDSCGTDTMIQTVIITGVGINDLTYYNPEAILYPNPFSSNATLEISGSLLQALHLEFIMVDLYGKEIMRHKIEKGESKVQIDRNKISSGMYFYKLSSSGRTAAAGKIIAD
jgi:PKD repeat protein